MKRNYHHSCKSIAHIICPHLYEGLTYVTHAKVSSNGQYSIVGNAWVV